MNKRNKVKQLNRSAEHRKAMVQNLVISLFRHERITSTVPKLKVARSYAERLITRAKSHATIGASDLTEKEKKEKQLHTLRYLDSRLRNGDIIQKLLTDLSQRYASRVGGYTRMIRLVNRQSDNSAMAILELVDRKTQPELKQAFKESAKSKDESKKAKKSSNSKAPKKS